MTRGSSHNSGPAPDPNSLRSATKRSFTTLPSEGYRGEIPEFPLPDLAIYDTYIEDRRRVKEYDEAGTQAWKARESELWEWAWRTPQAQAWAAEPWRQDAVAMWVRTRVLCEGADATAADKNSLHRFAEDIGLSPAGMARNGWVIAKDQVAEKREDSFHGRRIAQENRSVRDRLRDVSGGA